MTSPRYSPAPIDLTALRPSALIRLALADLSAAVKLGYTVDMSEWVRDPFHQGSGAHCTVCLAGAVMVSRCPVALSSRKERLEGWPMVRWGRMTPDLSDRFHALNSFRSGHIRSALSRLGHNWTPYLAHTLPEEVHVTPYSVLPEVFHANMTEMADALEWLGY